MPAVFEQPGIACDAPKYSPTSCLNRGETPTGGLLSVKNADGHLEPDVSCTSAESILHAESSEHANGSEPCKQQPSIPQRRSVSGQVNDVTSEWSEVGAGDGRVGRERDDEEEGVSG